MNCTKKVLVIISTLAIATSSAIAFETIPLPRPRPKELVAQDKKQADLLAAEMKKAKGKTSSQNSDGSVTKEPKLRQQQVIKSN
jgi:hypothetical protein